MRFATLFLLSTISLVPAVAASAAPPARVQIGLQQDLGFSSDDIADAENEPMVREIKEESGPRSLTVAGYVRIAASPSRVAQQIRRDRGLVKHAALKQSGTFGNPAVLSDVASYRLPKSDLEVIEECEVRDCKFKMRKLAIQEFAKLDWSASDVDERANALTRKLMVQYVNSYREKGVNSLVVYADKEQPMSLATGLRKLFAEATYVERYLSELDRHLEQFPNVETPGAEDLIYWSVEDYGYRPVTDVTHAVVYEPPDAGAEGPAAVIAKKHIFTSHYFQARVELIALFPDDTNSKSLRTYVVYVDRSLFDGEIEGFRRHLLVRSVLDKVRERMDALRQRFALAD